MANTTEANTTGERVTDNSSVREWIDRAIPAGSGRYYALLHSDPDLQEKQQLIATLVSIFSKLGFQSREVEVVKHKIDWWRRELEKESFDHPVMAALNTITPTSKNQLTQLLNGYATLLESGSPSTDEQNKQFHINTGAMACHLLCNTPDNNPAVKNAGIVLSRFRCYRYIRQHVDNGLLCLPMSSLDAADISPALLTPAASTDAVSNYFAVELAKLQQDMQESLNTLTQQITQASSTDRRNYKALFVYLSLQNRLLHFMCKDNTAVVEEVARLTPIRNYWYGFLAARRFDKLS